MIKKIWKQFNVSTVLVLPLFHKLTKDIFAKGTTLRFPFVQLAFEYGLINTYLAKGSSGTSNLHLLFDRDMLNSNLELTSSPYYSLCDMLVDNEYFEDVEHVGDNVLISLKIPVEFSQDLQKIMLGKYSKVSNHYKRSLKLTGTIDRDAVIRVPITENVLANYMATRDLGYAVCVKAKHIKDEVEELLGTELSSDNEFYQGFDINKETYSYE